MAGSRTTGLVVRRFDCAIDSSSVSSPMILIRIQTKPSRMLILGYLRCKHVLLWYVMPSAVERYVVEFEYESVHVGLPFERYADERVVALALISLTVVRVTAIN